MSASRPPPSPDCAAFGDQLTAYLDGELASDRVSAVRGHLRECEACRQAAHDLAALRDGLRALAPVDPPPSLWAGVQAQLAAQEVADAHRPSWRRAIARWLPVLPRFGGLALATAAAAVLLWWHAGRRIGEPASTEVAVAPTANAPTASAPTPAPPTTPVCPAANAAPAAPVAALAIEDTTADVAVVLATEPARTTARYTAAVDELLGLACDARPAWTDPHRTAFDATVTKLRAEITAAAAGRPREHAWRALVRYLQDTVVHDEVAAINRDHDRAGLAGTRGLP